MMLRRCSEGTWCFLQSFRRGDPGHRTAWYHHLHRLPLRAEHPLRQPQIRLLCKCLTESKKRSDLSRGTQRKELCVDAAPADPHQHSQAGWGGDWKLLWASIHTILPLLCPPKKDSPVIHPSLSRSYLYPVVGGFTSFSEFPSDITQICHHRWSRR